MTLRRTAVLAAACLLVTQALPLPARADNPMGYRMLMPQDAAVLPHNHGSLGLDVERAQHINQNGMTFDLMRIKQVRRGSAGAHAGFKAGDEIIAVDGQVFPTIATFASYVGSVPPGTKISVDSIPAGGGPQQAQRVSVTVGAAGSPSSGGMSTGAKIAIGVGAAAVLGCYEMGCFSHRSNPAPANSQQYQQQPNGQAAPYQQQNGLQQQ